MSRGGGSRGGRSGSFGGRGYYRGGRRGRPLNPAVALVVLLVVLYVVWSGIWVPPANIGVEQRYVIPLLLLFIAVAALGVVGQVARFFRKPAPLAAAMNSNEPYGSPAPSFPGPFPATTSGGQPHWAKPSTPAATPAQSLAGVVQLQCPNCAFVVTVTDGSSPTCPRCGYDGE